MDSLSNWKERGRYFYYKGHKIFYRRQGKGPLLLLIHGFPTASWDWHKIWPALTARFEVVAPDMIGFGFSDKPRRYLYSIHDQASLHEHFLEELKADACHVLAHDYGDTVVQELLARQIGRQQEGAGGLQIRSVCLLNGGLFPETHRARRTQKLLLMPVIGPLLARAFNRSRFQKSFSAVFGPQSQPSEEEIDAFWKLLSYHKGHLLAPKLIRYMVERERYRQRWVEALQHSPVPIRLINGPADPVSGLHMTERYRELVPNPDVVLLGAQTGHYPQVEDPEGVLKAYFAFVEPLLGK